MIVLIALLKMRFRMDGPLVAVHDWGRLISIQEGSIALTSFLASDDTMTDTYGKDWRPLIWPLDMGLDGHEWFRDDN